MNRRNRVCRPKTLLFAVASIIVLVKNEVKVWVRIPAGTEKGTVEVRMTPYTGLIEILQAHRIGARPAGPVSLGCLC